MSTEKLHRERVFVLGADYNDARLVAQRHPAVKGQEVSVLSAAAHRLTILGSVGGAHVRTVYVTPNAHRGEHYDLARQALQVCIDRAGGQIVHLDAEGGTYAAL